VKIKNK